MAARGRGQRMSTAARSAPYARPQQSDSRMASRDAWTHDSFTPDNNDREQAQWPPAQVSIRGASGPTWVVVGNLVLGTSTEDIQETFQQFGEIVEVQRREPPGPNHPSCSFLVGFVLRSSAEAAIKTLDKALADGRLLSVNLTRTGNATVEERLLRAAGVDYQPNGGANVRPTPPASIVQRTAVPASAPTVPAPRAQHAPPNANGPRSPAHHHHHSNPHSHHAHAHGRAGFALPQPQMHKGKFQAPGKGVPIAPASAPLQTRLLSVPELRALQKKQAREKARGKTTRGAAGAGTAGPVAATQPQSGKGKGAHNPPKSNTAAAATTSNLLARLAVPLEQRLLGGGGAGDKSNSPSTTTTGGTKKKKSQGAKGNVNGANLGVLAALQRGGLGGAPQSDSTVLSASQKKRKRKAAKLAAAKASRGNGGRMDVD